MSARVLNPMVFSEFYKIQTPSKSTIHKNLKKLDKIKRDLFGPPNPIEITKILDDELEHQRDLASKKWGFDFYNGHPFSDKSQFIWERVPFSDLVPTMYTLSRAAHCRTPQKQQISSSVNTDILRSKQLIDERANRENSMSIVKIINNNSCDEGDDETDNGIFKINAECLMTSCSNLSAGKRQPKITEYMNKRKRLSSAPKKISQPKRLRSNSSATSSGHFALFSNQTGAKLSRNKY